MNRRTIVAICAIAVAAIVILFVVFNRGNDENGNGGNEQSTSEMTTGNNNGSETTGNNDISGYVTEQDNIMNNMMESMMNVESSGNADISFLAGMIPHHQSAVEMAESYIRHGAENAEMKKLAENIIITQNEEINQMNEMIKSISESGENDAAKEASYLKEYNQIMHNGHSHSQNNYESVDMAFAEGMIEHHQMAVDMANLVLKYGNNEEVKKLAENIVEVQKKEIEEMNSFLNK